LTTLAGSGHEIPELICIPPTIVSPVVLRTGGE
jgi:hypothetical protein